MASGGANNAQHTTAYLVSGHRIWTTRERPQEIGQHQSGSQDLVYGSWDIGFLEHGILPLGIRGSKQCSTYTCICSFWVTGFRIHGTHGSFSKIKAGHRIWDIGFRGHGILPLGIRGSIQYSAYNCVSSFGSRELDYMGLAGALATSKQVTGLGIHELWVTGFMWLGILSLGVQGSTQCLAYICGCSCG